MHALAAATAVALSSMVAMSATAAERINLSGLQSSQTFDQFIVKYRDGSSQRADTAQLKASLDKAARALPRLNGRAIVLQHVRRMAVQADVIKADRKLDAADAESLMRQIAADPNVEYIEVNKLNQPVFTPNDTRFGEQFGFGTGAGGIRATEAWDITVRRRRGGRGARHRHHQPQRPQRQHPARLRLHHRHRGVGRRQRPRQRSERSGRWQLVRRQSGSSWHGTHVAGTVAAVTNNAKGVAGTAFSAKVVPVRVLGKCGGYDSDIADAMIWASGGTVSGVPANANPAEAINLSLGGSGACGSAMQTRDQRRGRSRHHAGDRGGQRQRQCFGLLARELRQCRRRRFGDQHRRALELLQLWRRRRHRGAGLVDPVHAQHRHRRSGHGNLCVLQRHLDGDAACRRRGRADPVGVESGRRRRRRSRRC